MNVLVSFTRSAWISGFKAVPCSDSKCRRWLTQRALDARPVGVDFEGAWFCSYGCVAKMVEARLHTLLLDVGRRAEPAPRMPLGLLLVSRGILSEQQLRATGERTRAADCDLGELLVQLGYATERQVASARAAQWGCPVFSPGAAAAQESVSLPSALMSRFQMAPMHVSDAGRRVLIGFSRRVAYGVLHAIEHQLQCRTQACIVAPSDMAEVLVRQARPADDAGVQSSTSVHEMARTLCNEGALANAHRMRVVRCGDFVWARLHAGSTAKDVLFAAGTQRVSALSRAASDASLIQA